MKAFVTFILFFIFLFYLIYLTNINKESFENKCDSSCKTYNES